MKVDLLGAISRKITSVRSRILPPRAVIAPELLRSPNADVLMRTLNGASKKFPNDPVMEEVSRCNPLVINTPVTPHQFMKVDDFLRVTAPFESKIVGVLPEEIQGLFPNEPSRAIKFLKEFANFLRTKDGFEFCLIPTEIKLSSGEKINAERIGGGHFGGVYKISTKEKDFAFKVFSDTFIDEKNFLDHGPIAESRTDAFLSDWRYKDYRAFYMADFSADGRWALSEFVENPRVPSQAKDLYNKRIGVSLRRQHPELSFSDGWNDNNYFLNHKFRVDPGGAEIEGLDEDGDMDLIKSKYPNLFTVSFETPFYGIRALFEDVPEAEKTFYSMLQNPSHEAWPYLSKAIEFLPEASRKDAFYAILNHPNPKIKKHLGEQVEFLPQSEFFNALRAVINHPDVMCDRITLHHIAELPYIERTDLKEKIMKKILAPYSTFSLG